MNKIAILFAILAVASATVQTNTPSSAFAIAPGKVFTNVTDTAFTSLTGPCIFNGGFDNTTNYVWCQTAAATATVPYTFQRRGINASSPGTVNSTMDTKLATTHMLRAQGTAYCAGPGYFGFASDAAVSSVYNLYFSYAAVNASSFTKVALTANTATGLFAVPQQCMFDNGIFYIVYMTYVNANNSLNAVYVQGVNVTSGAVYYNSTGGVKLFDYTAQSISTYIDITDLVGNNKTGSATSGLLLYRDDYTGGVAGVGSKYNVLPFTLATGAAGSLQTLATGASSTPTQTSASWTSTSTSTSLTLTGTTTYNITVYSQTWGATISTVDLASSVYTTLTTATTIYATDTLGSLTTEYASVVYGDTVSTSYTVSSVTTQTTTTDTTTYLLYSTITSLLTSATSTGVLTSTLTTSYGMSAFGSLSTYGVVLVQTISSASTQQTRDVTYAYTTSLFVNGSTSASTATNFTNPSGYHLSDVVGFSTSDGYAFVETMASNTGASDAYYLDQYFFNGTNKVTATSLGTFGSSIQPFSDATGSIWAGYTTDDSLNGVNTLAAGYAGQILYVAGASTLSSIFAALIVMIAALFAF